MGTSMMLVVQKDNELKIAQYYNWDGSPLDNGINIFKNLKLLDMDEFQKALCKTIFFNEYETKIYLDALSKPISQLTVDIPDSIMQTCDSLIQYISEAEEEIRLINDIESLDACNYVYFINFDDRTYGVYYNHFSDHMFQESLEICNIKYKYFERLQKLDLYNLPTIKEYKEYFD